MDIKQRANAFLNHYNYYKNTDVSDVDLRMARKIINDGFLQDLYINKNGKVSGKFFNESCYVRTTKDGGYKLNKDFIKVDNFENQEVCFNANTAYTKGFKCHEKSVLKGNKCIYETCPYLIAIHALDACKVIQREEVEVVRNTQPENHIEHISSEDNSVEYLSKNDMPSVMGIPQQLIPKAKEQNGKTKILDKKIEMNIEEEISKIKNDFIRNEFEKIYNRIAIMGETISFNLIPKVYLVTGDNKHLKNKLTELLIQILMSGKKKNYQLTNLLTDSKYAFENLTTLVKNYDKVCNDGYFQQKELFLTTLYRLEENNGFVIIDTTKDCGLDLTSILLKNSIDVKIVNLNIDDYSENELKELFKEELTKLGFTVEDSVWALMDNGYLKAYMKKNGNLKNKPLVEHLLATICDNLAKEDKYTVTTDEFPELLDKTKEQQSVESRLSKLIGLQSVKEQLTNLMSYLTFLKKMDGKMNMPILNLHSIFSGSPGTGKTTIARIYANMLFELGYIKENKLIEVAREDLIAEYVGQTAVKTKKVFEKAMGGVLFIDEAYSLTPTGGTGFEAECIATIIKIMEDHRDDIVVIFAGYEDDMEKFLDANEGLRSRVTNRVVFNDYSVEELYQILENSIVDLNLKLDNSAKDKIIDIISEAKKDSKFGNGRYIMNLRQKALMKHAINTAGTTNEEELFIIKEADFE